MRPFRPSLCRGLLLVCATALAGVQASCSSRGHGSDGQDARSPEGPVAEVPGGTAPLAELDSSGRLANRAVWPAAAAGQTSGRRSFFTFAAPAAGAFYPAKLVVTPVGCDTRQIGARLFAGRLAPDGRLESWQRIDPFEVIRMGEHQRLLLAVEGDAAVACGDVEVLLAVRYLETLKPMDYPASSGTDDPPVIVGPGPAPGTDPGPGPGPGPSPGPDPGPGTTPVPTPIPEPGLPACDGQGPSATDPAVLRATLRIYGQFAGGGTCGTTFTWRVADVVRRDPQNDCKYPEIRIAEGTGSPLLKLQATGATLATNLAWLQLPTPAERDVVKAKLAAGEAVDLVAPVPFGHSESERCSVPGVPAAPRLTGDLDLTLFQGDPREACLAGNGALQNLELGDAAHDFRVDRAPGSLKFAFTWPQSLVAPAGGLRLRAYDRRVKAFVSDWTVLTKGADGHFSTELKDDGAKVALQTQGDLELVIAEGVVPESGASCQRALLFPYARFFLDPAYGAAFHGSFTGGD